MKYYTSIEIDNCTVNITVTPVVYMDIDLWEITFNEKKYIIRKTDNEWDQGVDNELSPELLNKIGNAIDFLWIKDAG